MKSLLGLLPVRNQPMTVTDRCTQFLDRRLLAVSSPRTLAS